MNKFKNKKVIYDGFKFDSGAEKEYYIDLKILEKKGSISNLVLQPKFKFPFRYQCKNRLGNEVTYTADFSFLYNEDGLTKVIDVKSDFTAKDKVFRLKQALMKHFFNIDVIVVIPEKKKKTTVKSV